MVGLLLALSLAGPAEAAEATAVCHALAAHPVDPDRLQAALDAGASPTEACPIVRSRRRRLSFVEVMVGILIPPVGVLMLAAPGTEAYTVEVLPLVVALQRRSPAAIEALLAAGASGLDRSPDGRLALEAAVAVDLDTDEARWTHRLLGDAPVPPRLLCDRRSALDGLRTHAVLRRRLEGAGMEAGGRDCDGGTWLHRAAASGRMDDLEAILADGSVPVGARDDRGRTALYAAAARDRWEAADRLLAAGARVQGAGGEQGTVLHHAAATGPLAWVERALDAGVPLDARDESGATPLLAAARAGRTEAVSTLLARGAALPDAPGELALEVARSGDVALMELLLEAGLDPDARGGFDRTPLDGAWARDDLPMARLLVAHGADVSPTTRSFVFDQPSPLEEALKAHRDDWLAVLLPAATPEQRDRALVHVLIYDDYTAAGALLDAGADPSEALVRLAGLGDPEPLAFLRGRGARYPPDALLRMLPGAPLEAVAQALADGADPDATAEWRDRPVEVALTEQDAALLALLADHGADLAPAGDALRHALRREDAAWTTALLDAGAPVDRQTLEVALRWDRVDRLPRLLDAWDPSRKELRALRRHAWFTVASDAAKEALRERARALRAQPTMRH